MRRHRKRQPHVHPARIVLHRRIDKLLQLRERHNLIELPRNFALAHPQNRAAQKSVLAPGQLRMKSRAHLQQRPDPSVNLRPPGRRLRDPRKNLQQRGLPRAVPSDQPKHFAFFHFQRNVLQRPERLVLLAETPKAATSRIAPSHAASPAINGQPALVPLPKPFPSDDRRTHR